MLTTNILLFYAGIFNTLLYLLIYWFQIVYLFKILQADFEPFSHVL